MRIHLGAVDGLRRARRRETLSRRPDRLLAAAPRLEEVLDLRRLRRILVKQRLVLAVWLESLPRDLLRGVGGAIPAVHTRKEGTGKGLG